MKFIRNLFRTRNQPKGNEAFFNTIKTLIGFEPLDLVHYETAFTHRSLNKKNKEGHSVNYERLEFVGDAMLGSVIAHYLYKMVPSENEGYLTKMRSKIVSREHLNELGKELNLIGLIKSKIPKSSFGENIHGNLFEALVGAIYLDRGYSYCEKFIDSRIITPHIDIERLEGKVISYKSLLIEWCQKEKKTFNFDVFEDTGNDTVKHFGVRLHINKKVVAKARDTSKKKAEEKASKRAYFALQNQIDK